MNFTDLSFLLSGTSQPTFKVSKVVILLHDSTYRTGFFSLVLTNMQFKNFKFDRHVVFRARERETGATH